MTENTPASRMGKPRAPINHRREAERHASKASHVRSEDRQHPIDPIAADYHLRMAMVHATLARDEDAAASRADMRDANIKLRDDVANMRRIIVAHVADGLTRRELYAWRAASEVAKEMDGAGLNIDDAVEAHLEEQGVNPRRAWISPTDEVDPDTKTWTDLGGTVWDLTKAWTDRDGNSWTWTGGFDQSPEMKQADSDFVTSFDAVLVFGSPMTAADEAPATP